MAAQNRENRQNELRGAAPGASSQHPVPGTQHCLSYKPNLCQIVLAGPAWFSV